MQIKLKRPTLPTLLLILVVCVLAIISIFLFAANKKNGDWKTYINYRFNYSISYPKDWKEGRVATNGDGRALYKDNSNEILVYASYMLWSFSQQDAPIERNIFTTTSGIRATSLKETKNGKVKYIVFFTLKNKKDNNLETQYVFNVNVTEKFFKANEQIIIKVAKSLSLN